MDYDSNSGAASKLEWRNDENLEQLLDVQREDELLWLYDP